MDFPSSYLVQGLSNEKLNSFATITREVYLQKGVWVYHEGDEAEQVYVLKEGTVELITVVDGDIELPVSILRIPGDCFGTSSLIAPYVYSLSARCLEDSTLLAIKRGDLQNLIQEDRELGCIVMTNLAEHLLSRLKETRQELKLHFRNLLQFMHS